MTGVNRIGLNNEKKKKNCESESFITEPRGLKRLHGSVNQGILSSTMELNCIYILNQGIRQRKFALIHVATVHKVNC